MDALAALKMWACTATFPGVINDETGALHEFRIPPLPAADWITATMQRGHMSYYPGLLGEDDRDVMMDALADGHISVDELVQANRDALEEMSGWSWWSAARLIATLAASWETLGGLLTLAGVDPATKPLGAVLAAAYARMWVESSKEDRAKLAQQIAMPPPEMLTDEGWDEDAAEAAVLAFMAHGATGITEN